LPGAAADHATRGARDAAQRGRRAPAAAAVTAPGAEASAPRPDPTRDDAPARATGRAPDPRPHRARSDDRRRQAGEPLCAVRADSPAREAPSPDAVPRLG